MECLFKVLLLQQALWFFLSEASNNFFEQFLSREVLTYWLELCHWVCEVTPNCKKKVLKKDICLHLWQEIGLLNNNSQFYSELFQDYKHNNITFLLQRYYQRPLNGCGFPLFAELGFLEHLGPYVCMYVCTIEVALREDAHGIGSSKWAKGRDPSGS